jgi:serine/threonine-protein kinase
VKFTRGQDKGHKLTVMGTTIGSPFYMSPEQAKGAEDLDHRADVWAIAVIIYEALVGKVPFGGNNGPQILFRILGDEPMPPSMASDAAPMEIDDVVVKGLMKNPAQRFHSVGALADALGACFGLQGDHRRWANTADVELATELDVRKAAAPAPRPATPPPAATPTPIDRSAEDTSSSMRPPTTSTPRWLYAAVGAAAVAVLVVALLALR